MKAIILIIFFSSINLISQTLVGYWPFTGNAADSSGMGNHGTIVGNVTLTTDRFNNPNSSFLFNGGRINISNTAGFPSGNGQRTMCAWFKRNAINTNTAHYIFSIGGNSFNGCRSSIDIDNVNTWVGVENLWPANYKTWQPDTNWHFLCAVFPQGSTVCGDYKVYFDGVSGFDTSRFPNTPLNTNTVDPAIGCLGSANVYFFYGKIDDVRLYSTALNASQILELYNSPPPKPTLISPANNSTGISLTPLLDWSVSPFTSSYRVLLSSDSTFTTTQLDSTTTVDSLKVPSGRLTSNVKYYFKVKAINLGGTSPYTAHFNFTTSLNSSGWIQKSNGMAQNLVIQGFATIGTNLFTSDRFGGVYLSTNYGDNWTSVSNGLSSGIYKLAVIGNILFAASGTGGVYKSTNNGTNWTQVNNGLTDTQILNLAVKGTDIFAGTYDYGIFRTTNNGGNWSNCLTSPRVYGLYVKGNDIFAGTLYNGVYRSTDNGSNWVEINNGINSAVFNFTNIENNLFAGTRLGGVYLSTNNGDSWYPVNNGLIHDADMVVASLGTNVFAGSTGTGGVFYSTNNGGNWTAMNQGFSTIPPIYWLFFTNNYIFAGTNNSVWRRDLTEVFGLKQVSDNVPSSYSLSQNYPNPFNPTTKIKFDLMKSDIVTMKVFDMLGREVATLVNEQLKPGTYQVDWDGSNCASGVYFYSLTTSEFAKTMKMVLIK